MRLTRPTLMLLAAAIVVVFSAVLLERIRPIAEVQARAVRLPLFGESARSVTGRALSTEVMRIEIARHDEPALHLERDGRRWHQVEPFPHPLSTSSVEELLRIAASVRVGGRLDARRTDVAALGLDPPRATFTVMQGDQPPLTLQIGGRGLAGRAFLRVAESDEVLVVDAALHEAILAGDPRLWRDRRLFHHAGADSAAILVHSGEMDIQLEREGRTWRMRSPVRSRTSEPAIDRLLEEIGRARSQGFLADQPTDLERFGFAEPAGIITIRSPRLVEAVGGAETEEITERLIIGARMGASTQDRFGMVEGIPVVVRIGESVLRTFFRSPLDFAALNGTDVNRADVRTVTIRPSQGDPFELVRDLDDWREGEGGPRADARAVERLLRTLSEVQAARMELRPWPQERSRAIVTLSNWSGQPIATIRIGRIDDSGGAPGSWIMDNGDNLLRLHPASIDLPLTRGEFGLAEHSAASHR